MLRLPREGPIVAEDLEKQDSEDLTEKAREFFDDPDREVDEADLKLLKLQQELDAEEKAAEVAAAKEAEERAARRRAREEAAREAAAEAAEEASEEEDAPDEEEPDAEEEEGDFLSEKKAALSRGASEAVAEIAAGSLTNPEGVTAVATEVVKKRLPALPSKAGLRNGALAVAGLGVVTWMAWGAVSWVLGWLWTFLWLGMLGGAGYGAYKLYGLLPDSGDDEEAPPDEDESDA